MQKITKITAFIGNKQYKEVKSTGILHRLVNNKLDSGLNFRRKVYIHIKCLNMIIMFSP